MTCDSPPTMSNPSFRFRLEETLSNPPDDDIVSHLPPYYDDVGFFEDRFIEVVNFGEPPDTFPGDSGYLGMRNTRVYAKKLELKECFPPVLIRWKHYTKAAGSGNVTSTDESVLLDKGIPDYTWPKGTEYESDVRDGEWDADFEMYQTC